MKSLSAIKTIFCSYYRLLFFIIVLPTLPLTAQTTESEPFEKLLAKYHDYRLFNGSVLIAKGGEVIFKGGFGDANMSWNIPNASDTKFRIGSTTKQFTAALILTLVEQGKIDLTATVTDYLPTYPAKQGDRITIHHLLTHTSGIPSYTTPEFMTDAVRDPYEPDSLLTLFSGLELQFEPGTQWAYSNSGYILLGAIIEAVTGKAYDDVLRERILQPLDLDETGYDHYSEIIERKAAGYTKTPGGYERAPYLDTDVPYAAGMVYSTVEDLFKWDRSLYELGPFQQPATKALFLKQHEALPQGMAEQVGLPPFYGYGWFVGDVAVGDDTVKVIEHGGSIFGFSSGFWRMPEEQNTIIVLDNTSSSKVRQLGRGLMSLLYRHEPKEPQHSISDVLHAMIKSEGLAAARVHYKELFEQKPPQYDFAESELNELGYYYLRKGEVDTAIAVFKLNVESYPKSANVYDSLGEAYMNADNTDAAIKNYRKSLELNPNNDNARKMLQRLGADMK